jgi:hypothetical protein
MDEAQLRPDLFHVREPYHSWDPPMQSWNPVAKSGQIKPNITANNNLATFESRKLRSKEIQVCYHLIGYEQNYHVISTRRLTSTSRICYINAKELLHVSF